jgi:hypothetical protein
LARAVDAASACTEDRSETLERVSNPTVTSVIKTINVIVRIRVKPLFRGGAMGRGFISMLNCVKENRQRGLVLTM